MINETTVRSFLTLARTKSFTEAAKQLYLSQQAVSKHMAKLEEDVNGCLLVRERGNLALTELGEIYYQACSEMEQSLTRARAEAERRLGRQENRLVIGRLDLLDVYRFFKVFYRQFQTQNPDIELVYKSAPDWKAIEWVLDGKVDLSFTFEEDIRSHENELELLRLDKIQEMLVVPADHPLTATATSYLDFRNEPVFYNPIPEMGRERMEHRMKGLGYPVDNLREAENILSACSYVELMQGVVFLTDHCSLLNNPVFRVYPTGMYANLVLIYRKGNQKRALRRFVEEVAAGGAFSPLE